MCVCVCVCVKVKNNNKTNKQKKKKKKKKTHPAHIYGRLEKGAHSYIYILYIYHSKVVYAQNVPHF